MNECDALMGHLEKTLGKPEAEPEEIVALIKALPSATMPAGAQVSDLMMLRLRGIARGSDGSEGSVSTGKVPIHGRMFAQWMHHAYPRECPFPHFSGSTNPLFLEEWINETGKDYLASPTELMQHASLPAQRRGAPVESAPWIQKEELLVPSHLRGERLPPLWGILQSATLVPLVAMMALAAGLGRTLASATRALAGTAIDSSTEKPARKSATPTEKSGKKLLHFEPEASWQV